MKSDILSGLQILLQLFSIAIIRIGLGLVKWSRERSGEPIESWKIALDRFLSSLIYPQPPGDGGEGFALKAGQKVAEQGRAAVVGEQDEEERGKERRSEERERGGHLRDHWLIVYYYYYCYCFSFFHFLIHVWSHIIALFFKTKSSHSKKH